jgi:hypothetical protein
MRSEIERPDRLPDVVQTTRNEFEAEARAAVAVKLSELKRLLSGERRGWRG